MLRKPSDDHLSFLLGIAIGVMMLLSVVEMWIHNAMEHGWIQVTVAVSFGATLYRIVQPLLPAFQLDADNDYKTGAKGKNVGKDDAEIRDPKYVVCVACNICIYGVMYLMLLCVE